MSRFCLACVVLLGSAACAFAQDVATGQSDCGQSVALSQDGLVTGRVVAIDGPSKLASPLSGMDVLFVQNGLIARSTKTDAKGNFSVDGLKPGVYSFIALSAKGFVAYGVIVRANGDSAADSFMVAPAVAPRFVTLTEIVARFLPKRMPVLLEEIEVKTSVDGEAVVDRGANRILLKSGGVSGTVRTMLTDVAIEGTRVFLIQNDKIVDESRADSAGAFVFQSVVPGVYDFVAAGPAGFAALGFEAIQDGSERSIVVQESQNGQQVGDAAKAPADEAPAEELHSLLTPPVDGAIVSEKVEQANDLAGEPALVDVPATPLEAYDDAIGCGAACGSTGCGCQSDYFEGGACCGGCGGGGGGWFGPLAAATLFAWAISEFDDNNPKDPGPSSPSN